MDVRTLGSELESEVMANASRCATAGVSGSFHISDSNFPRFRSGSYPVTSTCLVVCVEDILKYKV
jgi:hypothetical protein